VLSQAISEERAQIAPLNGFMAANACNRARGKRSATAPLALEAMERIDAIFQTLGRKRITKAPIFGKRLDNLVGVEELCLPDSAPAVRADLSRDRLASVRRDKQFAIGAVLIPFGRPTIAHRGRRRLGCVSGGRAKSEERNNTCGAL
jgi:hypothetical protein